MNSHRAMCHRSGSRHSRMLWLCLRRTSFIDSPKTRWESQVDDVPSIQWKIAYWSQATTTTTVMFRERSLMACWTFMADGSASAKMGWRIACAASTICNPEVGAANGLSFVFCNGARKPIDWPSLWTIEHCAV